jgi:hypothetical protein
MKTRKNAKATEVAAGASDQKQGHEGPTVGEILDLEQLQGITGGSEAGGFSGGDGLA